MSKKIINLREEYTVDEAVKSGLTELFRAFEKGFREYLFPYSLMNGAYGLNFIQNFPNFNRYKGDLEKACHAAQTISKDYDLGIGIAKKGLWLSYVFNLYGLPTLNTLVVRNGNEDRLINQTNTLNEDSVKGKKILLFDNDLVTGNTVNALADKLLILKPEFIDLLLIYNHTEITPEFYKQVKPLFKNKPDEIGKMADGKIVLDAMCEIPKTIRKSMSLENDFISDRKYLDYLTQIFNIKL